VSRGLGDVYKRQPPPSPEPSGPTGLVRNSTRQRLDMNAQFAKAVN